MMVAFKANDEESSEISAYMKAHYFHSLPDFARVAVFAYIRKNKPGAHHSRKHTAGGNGAGRDSAPLNVGHSVESGASKSA